MKNPPKHARKAPQRPLARVATKKQGKRSPLEREALKLANDAVGWAKFAADELEAEQRENAESEARSLRIILRLIDGLEEVGNENDRLHELLAEYRAKEADIALSKINEMSS